MKIHDNSITITDNREEPSNPLYPACPGTQGIKKNSWRWKLQLLNISGMVYFFVYSFTALVVGMTVTLPELHKDSPDTLFYCVVVGWYVFIMLCVNYFFIVKSFEKSVVDSSTCSILLNNPHMSTDNGWKQCFTCNQLVPPRAKHCPLCNKCILKRDHHCFFAGCCIGFHNQRYFIVFCFFGILGALYSFFLSVGYLETYYAKLSSKEFYHYLLPWILWNWLMHDVTIGTVSMVIYVYCCVLTLAACAHYFLWQIMLLFTGQSSYERVKGIKLYKQSLIENLSSVFGPIWILNFICPMPFKNKGNGIHWPVYGGTKDQ